MKYKSSLPEINDNVTSEHPLKDLVVIGAWLVLAAVLIFWLLGMAVDSVVDNLSDETEAQLTKMLPSYAIKGDDKAAAQQAQLQAMVDGLRECAGMHLPAKVSVGRSDVPNAAVFPGGHIVIFSSLINHVQSENGLAYVLAHELAHIRQRDHLRALGRGIVLFGVSAILTGSDSGFTELVAPINHLGQAKYSRTRETAADVTALATLNCRYGHVGGATEFFEKMKTKEASLFGLSHYAASHPAMQGRIDTINAAIKAGGLKVGAVRALAVQPLK